MTQIFYQIIYTNQRFFDRTGVTHCIRVSEKELPSKVQELIDRKYRIDSVAYYAIY